jgi:predicted sulfurtransferase/23S rRNA-/tRNA-specific pseudouridylate synthase
MKHCILFYKYAPLSSDKGVMLLYQNAMRNMCTKLDLTGRVLIGLSDNAEGLNGTLAGDKENVLCYTYALMGKQWCIENKKSTEDSYAFGEVLDLFFLACQEFSQLSNVPIPNVDNLEDFKWSSSDSDEDLFPDLQIKLVKEIISTGGVLSSISIQETSKDYLTPDEWHDEMKKINDEDSETILIDCRNRKEFAVGHFENAIDPNTKIFAQFPKWVQENKSALKDKKVLMYCTGGIRCEKASAFIRNELKDVSSNGSVHHLKGGIHKYLDKFASEGFFRGKNFVFDRRLVMDAKEHKQGDDKESMTGQKSNCVGKCQYCDNHYDSFTGEKVCTVCRENCLVCEDCKGKLNREFHCVDHMHLRDCYFTNLGRFSREELQFQLIELEKNLDQIAVGRKHKQKRQTLYKQCERIQDILSNNKEMSNSRILCRSCGEEKCNGECWGVHGLERQKRIEKERIIKTSRAPRVRANKRPSKVAQKQKENGEIIKLRLSEPPNVHRCNDTGLRCPPPTIRTLSTSVKGKWCGNSIKFVMSSEFHEFAEASRLDEVFRHNLIFIDGVPVNCEQALRRGSETTKALSPDTVLKNMDIITRYQHWHEPPVIVPRHIDVERIELPEIVCNELIPNFNANDDTFLYCCNKPATVPVHPAGPYYQNTLLLMVEAQEGLRTRSLLPCHRLDRCTSGLTICCTNPKIARLIQVQMDLKLVSKMYIARVKVCIVISFIFVNKMLLIID